MEMTALESVFSHDNQTCGQLHLETTTGDDDGDDNDNRDDDWRQ